MIDKHQHRGKWEGREKFQGVFWGLYQQDWTVNWVKTRVIREEHSSSIINFTKYIYGIY